MRIGIAEETMENKEGEVQQLKKGKKKKRIGRKGWSAPKVYAGPTEKEKEVIP